jgi:hypothetical protein
MCIPYVNKSTMALPMLPILLNKPVFVAAVPAAAVLAACWLACAPKIVE